MQLKKVPAISKQELLFFIAGQSPAAAIQIVTRTGHSFNGIVISAGVAGDEGMVLVMQLSDDRTGLTDNFLHIAVTGIESVMVRGDAYAVQVLSQGKIQTANSYTVSGKIEVLRAFKTLSESLQHDFAVQTAAPEMDLPADGQSLNRIVKLTGVIQQVIAALLKEPDALLSWQQKYQKMVFVHAAALNVLPAAGLLAIHFPFNDTTAPEIAADQLRDQLLRVL